MRRRLLALAAAAAALSAAPVPAVAQDSAAPPGADKHWLPNEDWVNNLWLPFDEDRLYALLGATRGEVFRWVRIDAENSLAELGRRRRGLTVGDLSTRLAATPALRRRAAATLTQPHLGQHLLFHALHQVAIADRATEIFGVPERLDFLRLRRAELSPLQIGELYGRTRAEMARGAARALRDAADLGVRRGALTSRQRAVTLDRQLRQLPRWLGQKRYNGPTGGANRPVLPPGDLAKRVTLSADGALATWDAYRTHIPDAERLGEIHVRGARDGGGPFALSHAVDPRSRRPRSSYNSVVAAGGGAVAFESAESTYPLAKRVGQMSVWVHDLRTHRFAKVSHLGRPAGTGTRSAFNPSLSADGRLVAFEAGDSGPPSRTGLWLFDRGTGRQRLLARPDGFGGALLPRLSGDGRTVVFTDLAGGGTTQVHALDLRTGRRGVVSRGARGVADLDAYEPALSHDGAVVAFTSRATNLGSPGRRSRVWVHDRRTGLTTLVSGAMADDALEPALSPDGRWVAYVVRRPFRGGPTDGLRSSVWLHDRRRGTTRRVGGGRGYLSEPAVSRDGAHVAFTSTAPAPAKPRGLAGVLLWERASRRTRLLSEHAPGAHAAVEDPHAHG